MVSPGAAYRSPSKPTPERIAEGDRRRRIEARIERARLRSAIDWLRD